MHILEDSLKSGLNIKFRVDYFSRLFYLVTFCVDLISLKSANFYPCQVVNKESINEKVVRYI